jgi:hypothetical protein
MKKIGERTGEKELVELLLELVEFSLDLAGLLFGLLEFVE